MKIIPLIQEGHGQMQAWRRDIHAHPELGFEETRTAALVAEQLAGFGIEVHRGVGRTGVVGVLRNGTSVRSVGLRADMDALPGNETTSNSHRCAYGQRPGLHRFRRSNRHAVFWHAARPHYR
jgi:hippurate hydrolase